MPIISNIGRKSPKVRLLIGSIYAILIAGSVSMIYPFLLMISGSMKSAVDIKDFDAVARFLYDNTVLYRKYIEGLFNESLDAVRNTYDEDLHSFETIMPPVSAAPAPSAETQPPKASGSPAETTARSAAEVAPAEPSKQSGTAPIYHPERVRLWNEFLQETRLPEYTYALGFISTPASRTQPELLRKFKKRIMRMFKGDIDEVNRSLQTEFVNWNAFYVLPEDYLLRRNKPHLIPFMREFWRFKDEQPPLYRYYFSVKGFYKNMFLKTQYTRDLNEYNKAHGTRYKTWDEVVLTREYPADGTKLEREDWEKFVRSTLNLLWIRAKPEAAPLYRAYLKAKYADIAVLNRRYGTNYASFDDVPLIQKPPFEGVALSDWDMFLNGWKDPETGKVYILPVTMIRIHSVDFMFEDWLMQRFGSLDRVNQAMKAHFVRPEQIEPPQRDVHYAAFLENRGHLRREFAIRNYAAVLDYLVFHGRGVINTVIYCSLAVICALLVNPLGAYALSRYKLPSSYKILLFLMLTMAFPPMVTQIPVFLLLRRLHLLNTFAALVLPGLANGYSIFLLKGFFDSLPRELYESAQLDGAGEWTMFWQITMTLSKPILAVIGMNAFNLAYSNFMFALLICQDEKMWTLMVWLYQLQMRSGQAVVYASLIIAGIPTLLIFIFAQNIIMRGIVVPVEK